MMCSRWRRRCTPSQTRVSYSLTLWGESEREWCVPPFCIEAASCLPPTPSEGWLGDMQGPQASTTPLGPKRVWWVGRGRGVGVVW
jgi:hypothetical protein